MKIKHVRKRLKLTQNQMSKLMGVTQPALCRIETGKRLETKGQLAHLKTLEAIRKHKHAQDIFYYLI